MANHVNQVARVILVMDVSCLHPGIDNRDASRLQLDGLQQTTQQFIVLLAGSQGAQGVPGPHGPHRYRDKQSAKSCCLGTSQVPKRLSFHRPGISEFPVMENARAVPVEIHMFRAQGGLT
jgi:hypothetical protein